LGATVISTTRSPDKKGKTLTARGADHVIKEEDDISEAVFALCPEGVDRVIEMIGTSTLNNSLSLLAPGGIACMTGELGGEWEFNKWAPMEQVKSETYLTIFASTPVIEERLGEIFRFIDRHSLKVEPAHVLPLEEIRTAHRLIESGEAKGKIVIVTGA
jgi:NADPH2:quinone reductase